MPLRDDLLTPIPGDNPGGGDLRYAPVYDKIKEARRQDDDLAQGEWKSERKVADWPLTIKLSQEAIAKQSKDLQVAAWLTEALARQQGFPGLRDGLDLCRGLMEAFWEHLHPEIDDGDLEMRATPLNWIGTKLVEVVRAVPLTKAGHGYYRFKESRQVGYEDANRPDAATKARNADIKAGKLTGEAWDKAFNESPKALYAQAEKDLDASLESLAALDELCGEKFGDDSPALGKLKETLTEIRHQNRQFLNKKRETEPDPVEEIKPEEPGGGEAVEGGEAQPAALAMAATAGGFMIPAGGTMTLTVQSAEPADRANAVASVAAAAAYLRKREPFSPAPYLLLRGLRFGEVRAAAAQQDAAYLEAPPTEVRFHLKKLSTDGRWKELLEASENVMALPCSRAWLDLQRMAVEACVALGPEYDAIAIALRSELRALLRDLPQLLEATLNDDTPTANDTTRTWLRELLQEPNDAAPTPDAPPANGAKREERSGPGWQKPFIDPFPLAMQLARTGQEAKAMEIMGRELERQRSGRGRFMRKLQMVQLCGAIGKDVVAQPLLDEIYAAIDAHKLEEWEDRETLAQALVTVIRTYKKAQSAEAKQKLFERICKLDPVAALGV